MSEYSIVNSNKKICIDCGIEVLIDFVKNRCHKCYDFYRRIKKHNESSLKKCECSPECQEVIKSIGRNGKPIRFYKSHGIRGQRNSNYKNGRYFDGDYWYLTGIYDHPNSDKRDRISEHVYNFTQFNKCCMLSWGIVHHIDENKENNMPWNLQGLVNINHGILHNKLK